MTEQTRQEARAYGAGLATSVIVGTLVIGCGALLFALVTFFDGKLEAAGSGLMASAIAFGFSANAIWRR